MTNSQSSAPVPAFHGWNQRYADKNTGWDLGEPSPVLSAFLPSFLEHRGLAGRSLRAAVIGCGRGHDARFIASLGLETIGFDFAPLAIADARQFATQAGLTDEQLRFEEMDIFAIASEWRGQFDLVIEHTCFCAINPDRRPDYVDSVRSLLKSDGKLIGIFFTHNRPGGPPYSTTETEVLELFTPQFNRELWALSEHSIGRRKNDEYIGVFQASV
ncbi:MAG: methyltransferase [Cyanobacteria bacterium P01_H01_bin.130]